MGRKLTALFVLSIWVFCCGSLRVLADDPGDVDCLDPTQYDAVEFQIGQYQKTTFGLPGSNPSAHKVNTDSSGAPFTKAQQDCEKQANQYSCPSLTNVTIDYRTPPPGGHADSTI